MNDVYRNIIVSAAQAPLMRALAVATMPPGEGGVMYQVGFTTATNGALPPTHFGSFGFINQPYAAALVSAQSMFDLNAAAETPVATTLGEIEAALAETAVSVGTADEARENHTPPLFKLVWPDDL